MKWVGLIVGVCFFLADIAAQHEKVENALRVLLSAPEVEHATLGIGVYNLTKNSPVASYQLERSVAPASTMKLPLTAAALAILGPDFRFQTTLAYRGEIKEGILEGDLVLVGGGDPTLASRHFNDSNLTALLAQWTSKVKEAGIREITGDVIVDDGSDAVGGARGSWQYQDLGNYYGAGAFGFNIADNLYTVHFQQNPLVGGATTISSVDPDISGLIIRNEVRSGPKGSGDQAYIYGAPYQWNVCIRGTIPPGNGIFSIKGSMPDPREFASEALFEALQEAGLTVRGRAKISDYQIENPTIIFRHPSPPLQELSTLSNRLSVNLFTEGIGLELAKQDPEFDLTTFWNQRGVSTGGVYFDDFSGLSKNNTVTAAFMQEVLKVVYQDPALYKLIKPGLSIAGKSGTMRNMLRTSDARGKVFGKSGSISGVRGYIGYMETPEGETWAFTLLSQNFTGSSRKMSKLFEQFLNALYHAAQ
ncbi:MAG: D-alanyl-D-alanine carboxypeptidase/D-alanyl-D-alanine-endopeptidase [Saprospiraceae bacterium]|nr:D-alanyl-D-alanine carboxypeptidase/D-alanyl-D-alanine-endopeptidase [Saprospiraceae bacterium]